LGFQIQEGYRHSRPWIGINNRTNKPVLLYLIKY
jgi:hypothetical protein